MATDATGPPTPKGIPKYNTSVDAPSGLGFNAAMDAIDTLLTFLKVRKNSGGSDFERGRLNLIEGSGITITVADDVANNEVDVTIAAGGSGTKRFPIDLHTPQSSTNAGNAFWSVLAQTNYDMGHWQYVRDVDGRVFGQVLVPSELAATPNAKIRLALAANATSGVTRMSVATKDPADGETVNVSFTSETAQDVAVPGTAYLRKDISFTLTNAPAAGDLLIVSVFHEGAHANDTLAVNTLLLGAWLEVDVTN